MSPSIQDLIADNTIVAITLRQTLEPVEGRDVPVFPPTYPPNRERKTHRFDTPYTVNETSGVRVCDLDSVQSQANRMEAAFTTKWRIVRPSPSVESHDNCMEAAFEGPFAGVVPHHVVQAGERPIDLTTLPHRIADAAIRATGYSEHIRGCFEAMETGDPVPLASIAPTSLVYGAWDSRDTQVRIPRAVRSAIRAHDVSVFTRSTQYSGAFAQVVLGLSDSEWKKGADAGFAPTPSVDQAGGVLVHGEIVQSASILLSVLRKYRSADGSDVLPVYLLGLALGGLLTTGCEYNLRSGCTLVPAAPAQWQSVSSAGTRQAIEISRVAVERELPNVAATWADAAGVRLGGKPTVHCYEATRAKSMVKQTKADK